MTLDIITIPNKNLRKISKEISVAEIKTTQIQKFLDNLVETMHQKDGLGLAAIQVDKDLRVFCVATQENDFIFINPKILKKSIFKETQEEGCISIPQIFGQVKRSKKVTIEALDREAKIFRLTVSGLFARVIQHESDHLDGILFIDKAKITKGKEFLPQENNNL
jgi:peptide deformylase